jgi:tRNA A37 threonylcarbamoyladenosine dehydratase
MEESKKYMANALFNRVTRLLGDPAMEKLSQLRVIIFGLGGVGSWCAESLIRTGVGHLDMVDSDRVCVTNINRQLQATCETVGQVKVEALRDRLLSINPHAEIVSHQKIYAADSADDFILDDYDVVIDAIDSVSNKILLLHRSSLSRATVYCSLGAACKIDPTRIRTAEFMKVQGCPLGAKLRKQMRRTGMLPKKAVRTVYSDEVLENLGGNAACGSAKCLCPGGVNGPGDASLVDHEWCSQKAVINGSLAHITAIFGFTLAGMVVQDTISSGE